MKKLHLIGLAVVCVSCSEAEGPEPPPVCGTMTYGYNTLVPNPGQAGFDAALAEKARRHDRVFTTVSSYASGLNTEFTPSAEVTDFAQLMMQVVESERGSFDEVTGRSVEDMGRWHKSAGLYAGVGLAADAFRYGALREGGDDCGLIEDARAQLLRGMEGLHIASEITGVPGVVARSLIHQSVPNSGFADPIPLFDDQGNPLPEEKDNGTWRDAQTAALSDWVWEDSISRDMIIGWATAYGVIWEVIKDDDTIDSEVKAQLRADAGAIAAMMRVVNASGYDLEIQDADGRPTFHAYLNENAVDRLYVDGARNGFHAVMSLGIIGAFAYALEDDAYDLYLNEELVKERKLAQIAADEMLFNTSGYGSNFSNFNMAFAGMFLAQRYVDDPAATPWLKNANEQELYEKVDGNGRRDPSDFGQSYFDFTYAAGVANAKADRVGERAVDAAAVARGMETLRQFPDAPFFTEAVENCDADELESGVCELNDGTVVTVLGEVGWKGTLVSKEVVPMSVRPHSNYYWRSDPHKLNGGDSGALYGAVDFRIAYWMGRYIRIADDLMP